jgi:uncharacterized cupin superfamily protein
METKSAAAVAASPMEEQLTNNAWAPDSDVSFRLWARDDFKAGIWEATPGVSKAIRNK